MIYLWFCIILIIFSYSLKFNYNPEPIKTFKVNLAATTKDNFECGSGRELRYGWELRSIIDITEDIYNNLYIYPDKLYCTKIVEPIKNCLNIRSLESIYEILKYIGDSGSSNEDSINKFINEISKGIQKKFYLSYSNEYVLNHMKIINQSYSEDGTLNILNPLKFTINIVSTLKLYTIYYIISELLVELDPSPGHWRVLNGCDICYPDDRFVFCGFRTKETLIDNENPFEYTCELSYDPSVELPKLISVIRCGQQVVGLERDGDVICTINDTAILSISEAGAPILGTGPDTPQDQPEDQVVCGENTIKSYDSSLGHEVCLGCPAGTTAKVDSSNTVSCVPCSCPGEEDPLFCCGDTYYNVLLGTDICTEPLEEATEIPAETHLVCCGGDGNYDGFSKHSTKYERGICCDGIEEILVEAAPESGIEVCCGGSGSDSNFGYEFFFDDLKSGGCCDGTVESVEAQDSSVEGFWVCCGGNGDGENYGYSYYFPDLRRGACCTGTEYFVSDSSDDNSESACCGGDGNYDGFDYKIGNQKVCCSTENLDIFTEKKDSVCCDSDVDIVKRGFEFINEDNSGTVTYACCAGTEETGQVGACCGGDGNYDGFDYNFENLNFCCSTGNIENFEEKNDVVCCDVNNYDTDKKGFEFKKEDDSNAVFFACCGGGEETGYAVDPNSDGSITSCCLSSNDDNRGFQYNYYDELFCCYDPGVITETQTSIAQVSCPVQLGEGDGCGTSQTEVPTDSPFIIHDSSIQNIRSIQDPVLGNTTTEYSCIDTACLLRLCDDGSCASRTLDPTSYTSFTQITSDVDGEATCSPWSVDCIDCDSPQISHVPCNSILSDVDSELVGFCTVPSIYNFCVPTPPAGGGSDICTTTAVELSCPSAYGSVTCGSTTTLCIHFERLCNETNVYMNFNTYLDEYSTDRFSGIQINFVGNLPVSSVSSEYFTNIIPANWSVTVEKTPPGTAGFSNLYINIRRPVLGNIEDFDESGIDLSRICYFSSEAEIQSVEIAIGRYVFNSVTGWDPNEAVTVINSSTIHSPSYSNSYKNLGGNAELIVSGGDVKIVSETDTSALSVSYKYQNNRTNADICSRDFTFTEGAWLQTTDCAQSSPSLDISETGEVGAQARGSEPDLVDGVRLAAMNDGTNGVNNPRFWYDDDSSNPYAFDSKGVLRRKKLLFDLNNVSGISLADRMMMTNCMSGYNPEYSYCNDFWIYPVKCGSGTYEFYNEDTDEYLCYASIHPCAGADASDDFMAGHYVEVDRFGISHCRDKSGSCPPGFYRCDSLPPDTNWCENEYDLIYGDGQCDALLSAGLTCEANFCPDDPNCAYGAQSIYFGSSGFCDKSCNFCPTECGIVQCEENHNANISCCSCEVNTYQPNELGVADLVFSCEDTSLCGRGEIYSQISTSYNSTCTEVDFNQYQVYSNHRLSNTESCPFNTQSISKGNSSENACQVCDLGHQPIGFVDNCNGEGCPSFHATYWRIVSYDSQSDFAGNITDFPGSIVQIYTEDITNNFVSENSMCFSLSAANTNLGYTTDDVLTYETQEGEASCALAKNICLGDDNCLGVYTEGNACYKITTTEQNSMDLGSIYMKEPCTKRYLSVGLQDNVRIVGNSDIGDPADNAYDCASACAKLEGCYAWNFSEDSSTGCTLVTSGPISSSSDSMSVWGFKIPEMSNINLRDRSYSDLNDSSLDIKISNIYLFEPLDPQSYYDFDSVVISSASNTQTFLLQYSDDTQNWNTALRGIGQTPFAEGFKSRSLSCGECPVNTYKDQISVNSCLSCGIAYNASSSSTGEAIGIYTSPLGSTSLSDCQCPSISVPVSQGPNLRPLCVFDSTDYYKMKTTYRSIVLSRLMSLMTDCEGDSYSEISTLEKGDIIKLKILGSSSDSNTPGNNTVRIYLRNFATLWYKELDATNFNSTNVLSSNEWQFYYGEETGASSGVSVLQRGSLELAFVHDPSPYYTFPRTTSTIDTHPAFPENGAAWYTGPVEVNLVSVTLEIYKIQKINTGDLVSCANPYSEPIDGRCYFAESSIPRDIITFGDTLYTDSLPSNWQYNASSYQLTSQYAASVPETSVVPTSSLLDVQISESAMALTGDYSISMDVPTQEDWVFNASVYIKDFGSGNRQSIILEQENGHKVYIMLDANAREHITNLTADEDSAINHPVNEIGIWATDGHGFFSDPIYNPIDSSWIQSQFVEYDPPNAWCPGGCDGITTLLHNNQQNSANYETGGLPIIQEETPFSITIEYDYGNANYYLRIWNGLRPVLFGSGYSETEGTTNILYEMLYEDRDQITNIHLNSGTGFLGIDNLIVTKRNVAQVSSCFSDIEGSNGAGVLGWQEGCYNQSGYYYQKDSPGGICQGVNANETDSIVYPGERNRLVEGRGCFDVNSIEFVQNDLYDQIQTEGDSVLHHCVAICQEYYGESLVAANISENLCCCQESCVSVADSPPTGQAYTTNSNCITTDPERDANSHRYNRYSAIMKDKFFAASAQMSSFDFCEPGFYIPPSLPYTYTKSGGDLNDSSLAAASLSKKKKQTVNLSLLQDQFYHLQTTVGNISLIGITGVDENDDHLSDITGPNSPDWYAGETLRFTVKGFNSDPANPVSFFLIHEDVAGSNKWNNIHFEPVTGNWEPVYWSAGSSGSGFIYTDYDASYDWFNTNVSNDFDAQFNSATADSEAISIEMTMTRDTRYFVTGSGATYAHAGRMQLIITRPVPTGTDVGPIDIKLQYIKLEKLIDAEWKTFCLVDDFSVLEGLNIKLTNSSDSAVPYFYAQNSPTGNNRNHSTMPAISVWEYTPPVYQGPYYVAAFNLALGYGYFYPLYLSQVDSDVEYLEIIFEEINESFYFNPASFISASSYPPTNQTILAYQYRAFDSSQMTAIEDVDESFEELIAPNNDSSCTFNFDFVFNPYLNVLKSDSNFYQYKKFTNHINSFISYTQSPQEGNIKGKSSRNTNNMYTIYQDSDSEDRGNNIYTGSSVIKEWTQTSAFDGETPYVTVTNTGTINGDSSES